MSDPIKLEPSEIKVNLYTNIPDTKDYTTIPLTFSMLSSPDLKIEEAIKPGQYPFFSFQVKYDESLLSKLSYSDVVKTFFIKDDFFEAFYTSGELFPLNAPDGDSPDKQEVYYNERTSIIDNNVMIMLKYLLPTRFPVINNHYNSYRNIFLGETNLKAFWYNPMSTRKPIFLKIGGGTYTVKKLTWLSDFLNHPVYKKIANTGNISKTGNSSNKNLVKFIDDKKDDVKKGIVQDKKKLFDGIKDYYKGERENGVKDSIYTGIQIVGLDPSTYEIYVDVELFEGELKPEDEGNVKCPYYSNYLGDQLENIIKEASRKKRMEEAIPKIIKKNPIFNTKTFTTRKQEAIETEEELDEKTKAKREEENRKYVSYLDEERRNMYEPIMIRFFKDMKNNPKINAIIKNNDINYKNFFTEFLLVNRYNLNINRELEKLIDKLTEDEDINEDQYAEIIGILDDKIDGRGGLETLQRTVEDRKQADYLIAMSQVAKELLNRNDVVKDDTRKQGIVIAKQNSDYNKLVEYLPREGYDRIAKLYNSQKAEGSNFNYKEYYLNFVRTLQNSQDNGDKFLFQFLSRGRGRSNEIATAKARAESMKKNINASEAMKKNYEIALELLDYVEATRSGGKRTQRNKNKKRRRTRRRY